MIVIEKTYSFGTLSAWYDDPEKGWQSENEGFLRLLKCAIRGTPTKYVYNPDPVYASAVAACERLKAKITRADIEPDDLPPGTIY